MEYVRVDSSNHTTLAMLSLRAVEPDWLGVGNADGVCEEVLGRGGSSV